MLQDNQKDQLEKLLTRLVDSYDGYQQCSEKAEQNRHNALFTEFGATRRKFANDVREIMNKHGIEVDDDGSFLAKAHRFYTDVKFKLDHDDEELLESIAYREGVLLAEYKDTIKEFSSDESVLTILQKQYREIQNNYELIQAKEEAA